MKCLNVAALIVASAIAAIASGPTRAEDVPRGSIYDRICAARTEHSHHHKMAERLARYLSLTDGQKAAYQEFVDARTKAVDDAKAALCAAKPDLSTFESRLAFHQNMLEARLAALKAENPKLLAFYNSLDAAQKERFDQFRRERD